MTALFDIIWLAVCTTLTTLVVVHFSIEKYGLLIRPHLQWFDNQLTNEAKKQIIQNGGSLKKKKKLNHLTPMCF